MDSETSKLHGRRLKALVTIYRKEIAGVAITLLIMYLLFSPGSNSNNPDPSYNEYETSPKEEVHPQKKTKKPKLAASVEQNYVHKPETLIAAGEFNKLLAPMEKRSDELVICPNMGGGGKNKQCSKGYIEFTFDVNPGTEYYLYIQAIGPTIMDNSLWVGTLDATDTQFLQCDTKHKAGPLVPHKHISKSRWLCCPKYLAKNAKKGQAEFYSQCCYFGLGPKGDEVGCVLDLEVDTAPHWNQVPRKFSPSSNKLVIRLYAREDGTAVTKLYLSTRGELNKDEIA